jgi:hypothetical protein
VSSGDTPDAISSYQKLQNLAAQLGPLGVSVTLPTAPPGTPATSIVSESGAFSPIGVSTLPAASGTSASSLLASYNQYVTLYNQAIAAGDTVDAASYASALQTLAQQLAALGVTVSLPTGVSTALGVTASAPATTVVSTPSVTDEVAAWLSGSTLIGSYSVPNALLAGAVVLGFALLTGRKK